MRGLLKILPLIQLLGCSAPQKGKSEGFSNRANRQEEFWSTPLGEPLVPLELHSEVTLRGRWLGSFPSGHSQGPLFVLANT